MEPNKNDAVDLFYAKNYGKPLILKEFALKITRPKFGEIPCND